MLAHLFVEENSLHRQLSAPTLPCLLGSLSVLCQSSQDYTAFSRLLLISAGIGITPTVSLLRDVLHKS